MSRALGQRAAIRRRQKWMRRAVVGASLTFFAVPLIAMFEFTTRDIIKDTNDKGLKAMAYNAMGKNLYEVGQLKEARWPFLWVDTIYNQDKEEHAKALFLSLIHIWRRWCEPWPPFRSVWRGF